MSVIDDVDGPLLWKVKSILPPPGLLTSTLSCVSPIAQSEARTAQSGGEQEDQ